LFLAGVLIAEEEQLYKAAEARSGGFRGWKKFIVTDIVAAADDVKTFTFRPESPTKEFSRGFEFLPGQFLSASVDVHQNSKAPTSEQPEEIQAKDFVSPRHYTITVSIQIAPMFNTPIILTQLISPLLVKPFCKFQPSVCMMEL
jgi:nitric oxide dioxygenase